MRIGDAERDRAAARLRDYYAEGRLTLEEFNDRLAKALEAKTHADLLPLLKDLPGRNLLDPVSLEAEQAYGFSSDPAVAGPQPGQYVVPQPSVPVQPPTELHRPWYAQWWMLLVAILLTSATDGRFGLGLLVPAAALWIWVIYPSLAKAKQPQPVLPPAAPEGANLPLTYEGRELVLNEIRAGRKLVAMKTYRHLTGASLYDAKNAVDALERGF